MCVWGGGAVERNTRDKPTRPAAVAGGCVSVCMGGDRVGAVERIASTWGTCIVEKETRRCGSA